MAFHFPIFHIGGKRRLIQLQKYENFCKPPNDFLIIVFDKSKISRMMWLCVWFLGTDFFGTEDFFGTDYTDYTDYTDF